MAARRRVYGRATAALMAMLLCFVAGTRVGTAHAQSLGTLTSQTLLGTKINEHAITDTFNRANGTLDNSSTADGTAWDVSIGSFSVSSNKVKATVVQAEATVPGFVNVSVGGDMHTGGSSKSFGIIAHAAGGGSTAATFLVFNKASGVLTLERVSATGVVTSWGTASGISMSNNYLLLKYLNGTYTAYVAGVLKITHVCTTAERTDVEAASNAGIGSVDDTTTTFDDFMVYPL